MARVLHPKPSLRLERRGALEGLFDESDVEWDPIEQEFWADADSAERLVRRFLVFCESPRTRTRARAMVRGSVAGGRTGRRVYAFVNRLVVHPALQAAGIKASAMRMELVASQLIGMAMMRYVLEVEPMASATPDEIVELMAPSVRAALDKDRDKDRSERGRRSLAAEPGPAAAAPDAAAEPLGDADDADADDADADDADDGYEPTVRIERSEPESWFTDFHDETVVLRLDR